jgi:hypothetical protein
VIVLLVIGCIVVLAVLFALARAAKGGDADAPDAFTARSTDLPTRVEPVGRLDPAARPEASLTDVLRDGWGDADIYGEPDESPMRSVAVGEARAPAVVVCDQQEASCVCALPYGHHGPHACDCGGRWTLDQDGEFVAVRLPGIFGAFS